MDHNPRPIAEFYDIPQEQISEDLSTVWSRSDKIRANNKRIRSIPYSDRSVSDTVALWHGEMLLGYWFSQQELVPIDMAIYYAAMSVATIASDAVSAAMDRGELLELLREIREIEQQHGLEEDDFWFTYEGPEDWQELQEKAGDIMEGIDEVVFEDVLRRYGLGEIADLHEKDRMRFDVMKEAGRRALWKEDSESENDANVTMRNYLLKEYGASAVALLDERLVELSRLTGRDLTT